MEVYELPDILKLNYIADIQEIQEIKKTEIQNKWPFCLHL